MKQYTPEQIKTAKELSKEIRKVARTIHEPIRPEKAKKEGKK